MLSDLSGKRFGILGIGKSGIGAAGLINRLGGTTLISDMKRADQLYPEISQLQALGIEIETGGHNRLLSEKFEVIIVSPGVVLKQEWLESWRKSDTQLWSEIELASKCYPGMWIGVTGSNGKTTTVTLLTNILKKSGLNAISVGNFGSAWSEHLPAKTGVVFVVEISSFQMEYTHTALPNVCVILNVLENHLDRHGDIETYGQLKLKLAAKQTSAEFIVLNADDDFLMRHSSSLRSELVLFGKSTNASWAVCGSKVGKVTQHNFEEVFSDNEWELQGEHNLMNAAAASAAASCVGVSISAIHDSLIEARPVEHRIEFVRAVNSIRYVNDSKSTNLAATLTAISAIEAPIVLLFGGRPKQESFAPLRGLLGNRVSQLIVFGEAQAKIRSELPECELAYFTDDLQRAFELANQVAKKGSTVLLSPGCASYDQFTNFEQRGKVFKTLVNQI